MNRQRFLNFAAVLGAAVIAVAVVLGFFCAGAGKLPAAKETEGLFDADGTPVAAVSVLDLVNGTSVLSRANYTENEFLKLSPASSGGKVPFGKPVNLSETNFARRGTLRFVILNLDPWAEDFDEQSETLAPYLGADNDWHFSLYLPPIFSACTVYVRAELVAASGAISDYNFIDYSEYNYESVRHEDGTQPFLLDLSFPSKRTTIIADRLRAAVTVTVHYEGARGGAGLTDSPIVGAADAVEKLISRDEGALNALVTVSALALAVFIFLCFLKRSFHFLPQPLMLLGVFGVLLSAFAFAGATAAPFLWQAVGSFSLCFLLGAAACALRVKRKNKPVWLVPAAFCTVNCLISLFMPSAAYLALANAAAACAVLALAGARAMRAENALPLTAPVLVSAAALAAAFYPKTALLFENPILWLFALAVAAIVAVCFQQFARAEKQNRYLAANLAGEVERQTKDLREVVAERDTILMYVSHDMKKPVVTLENYLTDLRQHAADENLAAKVDYMLQKNRELKNDFAELSKFSKRNYLAELSEVFNAAELVKDAAQTLRPDCDANGIALTFAAPAAVNVYAKRNALSSVVLNLILNAIEHSYCTELAVSVSKRKGFCRIEVSDNGRGIAAKRDIFEPYYSANPSEENAGLGLYLARNAIRSMGGELSYKQENGKLTFTVTVPLA